MFWTHQKHSVGEGGGLTAPGCRELQRRGIPRRRQRTHQTVSTETRRVAAEHTVTSIHNRRASRCICRPTLGCRRWEALRRVLFDPEPPHRHKLKKKKKQQHSFGLKIFGFLPLFLPFFLSSSSSSSAAQWSSSGLVLRQLIQLIHSTRVPPCSSVAIMWPGSVVLVALLGL